jgi:hypothetical protein
LTRDDVFESLGDLLGVKPGSLPTHPAFGSDVGRLLHEMDAKHAFEGLSKGEQVAVRLRFGDIVDWYLTERRTRAE